MSREVAHVAGLFVVAIAVRVLLFKQVGVFGDFGYWAYDSRMVLRGQTPFVDFPGRSPAMIYLLALVRDIVGQPVYSLRATVVTLWLLTGIPVYLLAKRIRDHASGCAALAVFLLLPFPLTYGMFLNSQALGALFGMVAVYLVYTDESYATYALVGMLIAVAFLSRRSVIVFFGPIGLYTLWRRYDRSGSVWTSVRDSIGRGVLLTAAFVLTLLIGYIIVARWQVGNGIAIFNIDLVGLFTSHGRGAYPMVGQRVPAEAIDIATHDGLLGKFCPVCGSWTAKRAMKMMLLSIPIFGLFFYYFRDLDHHYFTDRDDMYLLGGLLPLAVYASWLTLKEGFILRFGAILCLMGFAYVVYRTDRIKRDVLYSPGMAFILSLLVTVIAGYLYRERRIIVYYMMDAWPFIAIIAGVLAVAAWRRGDRRARVVLTGLVIAGIVISALTAVPLTEVAFNDQTHWFTLDKLETYGTDLSARTDPGDRVLSPHPSYIATSDARLWNDNSRILMEAIIYDESRVGMEMFANLTDALRTGEIGYVAMAGPTRETFANNESVTRAFETNYCQVPGDRIYTQETNASLYRYEPDCPPNRTWVNHWQWHE